MDHPNIARILDAGTVGQASSLPEQWPAGGPPHGGRPFFVMELVRGIPINEFCDQKRLPVRQRLELFVQVCQAVQHAHQKGVIHRDLKPTNVLVTMADSVAVPKVIDFGIAKALGQSLTDHTLHTGFAQLVGTPLYMSPEQAEMNQFGVDTRSDVYSLGVMLYELLTGTTPFDKETLTKVGFDEMRRIIREQDPPRPSTRVSTLQAQALSTVSDRRSIDPRRISTTLRGELDWIVMKVLEKERTERYESASSLAKDIERYLAGDLVHACPPSAAYRFRKFARKHRVAFTTATLLAASLLLGIAGSAWQAIRATRAEALAKSNESLAKNNELLAKSNAARALSGEQQAREGEQAVRAALIEVELQRKKARQAVDEMYTQVAEKWLNNQGNLTALQREFLEKALARYEEFAAEAREDSQLQLEAVRANNRVGAIRERLGQEPAAEETYRRTIDKCMELLKRNADLAEWRIELGDAHAQLSRVYRHAGRQKDAAREAELAESELSKVKDFPLDDPKSRSRLAAVLINVASRMTMLSRDRAPIAERAAQAAIAAWKSLVADYPQKFEYRSGLASAYATYATNLMWWGGSDEKVVAAFIAADTELSKLMKERPGNVQCRHDLAIVLGNLGVVYGRRDSRSSQIVEVLRRELPICEGLAREFPDVPGYQDNLARVLVNLTRTLRNRGDSQDVEDYMRRALQIRESLASRYPDNAVFYREMLREAPVLMNWLKGEKRYDDALAIANEILARINELERANPELDARTDPGFKSVFYCNRAGLLTDTGDHAQAVGAIEQLVARLTAVQPGRPTYVFQTVYGLLQESSKLLSTCASLVDQDVKLRPVERARLIERYAERAAAVREQQERSAEDYVRSAMSSPELIAAAATAIIFLARNDNDWFLEKPLLQDVGLSLLSGPADSDVVYQMADLLSSAPESHRYPELGLKLARRAVELNSTNPMCWQSLCWALYRSGDFSGCLDTAKRENFSDSESLFVLAMANWHLGNQEAAYAAFARGDQWLKGYEQRFAERAKNGSFTHPQPTMLRRLQAEARSLLGIADSEMQ